MPLSAYRRPKSFCLRSAPTRAKTRAVPRLKPAAVPTIHGQRCRWLRRPFALALAIAFVSAEREAAAQAAAPPAPPGAETITATVDLPGAAPPPAELPTPGTRTAVMLTGAAVFVGWYGAAVGQSFLWPDAPAAEKLRIPVVGPWMMVAKAGCHPDETECTDVIAVIRAILAGATAVGQLGGLAVMAEGAFLTTAPAKPAKSGTVQGVSVVATGDRVGIDVVGVF